MNESYVKKVIVLNHDFFEEYLRKYKGIMDDIVKEKIEGLVVMHKNLMVYFKMTEEDKVRYHPDSSDECFICNITISNIGERVVHIFEHIKDDIREVVDYREVVNTIRWLVAYGNYMNAVVKNVPMEERISLVEDMVMCMKKLEGEEV